MVSTAATTTAITTANALTTAITTANALTTFHYYNSQYVLEFQQVF